MRTLCRWIGSLFSGKNVDEMWFSFKDRLLAACLTHIPSRCTAKQKSKKSNWMTKATIKLMKKCNEGWHKYERVCSMQNYTVYKRLRNKVTTAIQNNKEKCQLQLVKSFKANPKRLYGYVSSKQTVKTTTSSLLKEDGSSTNLTVSLPNCCVNSFKKFLLEKRTSKCYLVTISIQVSSLTSSNWRDWNKTHHQDWTKYTLWYCRIRRKLLPTHWQEYSRNHIHNELYQQTEKSKYCTHL